MKHQEKIYEFDIQHRLSPTRRKAIEKFFAEHGGPSMYKATMRWDEEDENVLHIKTLVVIWEVHFSPKKVEVYGSGPFWARMLFTDHRKEKLKLGIYKFLEATGFFKKGPAHS
jgi:hypothetical protein